MTDGRIEPRWLTVSQIGRIHDEQLQMFGGPGGLRDAGLLASAIDRPRNKWSDGEQRIAAMAAAYAFGISRNHPSVDGNQRTAFAAMVVFLANNGDRPGLPQPDAVRVMLDLAAGAIGGDDVTAWLATHLS